MDLIPSLWNLQSNNSRIFDDTNLTNEVFGDGEEQLFKGYSHSLLSFASTTCLVFVIVGVPGNLITIIALARCKKVRNATAVFIINLSLSDLLFCCFNLPLAASTFWWRAWVHGELLCRLFPLMRYGLLAVSLFTVLAITINRYVMIGHPRIYPRIYRNRFLGIMVAATWLCAFSSLIPTWRGVWGSFGLDKSIGSCTILPDNNGTSPKEFLFIMAFIIPCISIVVCYARIFYIVRKTAMRSHDPHISTQILNKMPGNIQKANLNFNNNAERQLLDKTIKIHKDDSSENSSSLSTYSGYQQTIQPNIQCSRPPNLSKVKEDGLKYIDTSAESDFPPSLSAPKVHRKESTPTILELMESNGKNIICLRSEMDSAVEDSTSSSEHNQLFHITNNSETSNQLLSVQVEPSSSSGIEMPIDHESPPRRRNFKKSFKYSVNRVTKRQNRDISTNTSGASILYPGRMTQKDRRLLKMILAIFSSFLICYLPITITKIAKGAMEIHIFHIMGYLLIYLTTCINPIIYVVMSSEYRQAYWNLLLCRPTTGGRTGKIRGPIKSDIKPKNRT